MGVFDNSYWAWTCIVAFAAAYDYWAIKNGKETLSRGVWNAFEHPASKWPVILMLSGLYKHLVFPNFLPKADILYYVAERWHKNYNAKQLDIT